MKDFVLCEGLSSPFEEALELVSPSDGVRVVEDILDLKKKKNAIIIADGRSNAREFLERGVDVIYNIELAQAGDSLHFRYSGLNQVLCAIAAKKNVCIAFNIGLLLRVKGQERAAVLGKMRQNVVLCRKYKVHMILASFALSEDEVRCQAELWSLGVMVGMTVQEAKKATQQLHSILAKLQ